MQSWWHAILTSSLGCFKNDLTYKICAREALICYIFQYRLKLRKNISFVSYLLNLHFSNDIIPIIKYHVFYTGQNVIFLNFRKSYIKETSHVSFTMFRQADSPLMIFNLIPDSSWLVTNYKKTDRCLIPWHWISRIRIVVKFRLKKMLIAYVKIYMDNIWNRLKYMLYFSY